MIWLSLVLPTMGFVVWAFPRLRRTDIWRYFLTIALIAAIAWIGYRWFRVSYTANSFSLKTLMFSVTTAIDAPILAFVVGSAVNLVTSVLVGYSPAIGIDPINAMSTVPDPPIDNPYQSPKENAGPQLQPEA